MLAHIAEQLELRHQLIRIREGRMSVQHFNEYFEKYSDYYNTTVETAKEFARLVETGEIPEERIHSFMEASKPVADTFFLLKKVKDLIDIPDDFTKDEGDTIVATPEMETILIDTEQKVEKMVTMRDEDKERLEGDNDTTNNN